MKSAFSFKTNPNDDHHIAQEMCGLLPYWVRDYAFDSSQNDLLGYMKDVYGCGNLYRLKGTIKSDQYVSPYEEDAPLDYIAQSEIAEGTVYYFPYGIIALPVSDGHFITRMD